jgi:probable F420-dependent oxidoreductase
MSDNIRRGVVFPQGSIPSDPESVRRYVTHLEKLGYDHLLVPDHVLGVEPRLHPGWRGPYDINDGFHEPMVLFGFLSAFSSLELVAGVVVLPQRQAALVAKQAAQVDLLSGGRLRLGVGIGWNQPEYEGMGMPFRSRGRRIDEQISVMRRLWTEQCVSFEGEDHTLDGVGIAPLPVQRPIPVWIGAERATPAFERVGRLGDGWMAMGVPGPEAREGLRVIRASAQRAGRDPDALGIQAWVTLGDGDQDRISAEIRGWVSIGATHIAMNTRTRQVTTLNGNLKAAEEAMAAFDQATR